MELLWGFANVDCIENLVLEEFSAKISLCYNLIGEALCGNHDSEKDSCSVPDCVQLDEGDIGDDR